MDFEENLKNSKIGKKKLDILVHERRTWQNLLDSGNVVYLVNHIENMHHNLSEIVPGEFWDWLAAGWVIFFMFIELFCPAYSYNRKKAYRFMEKFREKALTIDDRLNQSIAKDNVSEHSKEKQFYFYLLYFSFLYFNLLHNSS